MTEKAAEMTKSAENGKNKGNPEMNTKSEVRAESTGTRSEEPDFIDAEFLDANFAAVENGNVENGNAENGGDAPQVETFPLVALQSQPTAALSVIEAQAGRRR